MEPKVWIGMGGWELPPFKKYFYPPKPKKTFRKLKYYSQYFDIIEVNSSFYNAALQPHHSQQWLSDVSGNREFIFTVKLYRGFTHTFNATKGDVKAIHHLLDPLANAEKLGGLVIQFPYSFFYTPARKEYVARLGKSFQPHRIFVEFRHKSWNNSAITQFLAGNNLHSINVDPSGRFAIVADLAQVYPDAARVATGGSKGGMTAVFHRRFFPDDVDGTVPYVAPISFSWRQTRAPSLVATRSGSMKSAPSSIASS